jgi:AraC-like DNA-binding protein
MGQPREFAPTPKEMEQSLHPVLCLKIQRPSERDLPPHAHTRGQLFSLRSGLVIVQVESGTWVLPPHCCGWIPPGQSHAVRSSGPVLGWCVFVAADLCSQLPQKPCVLDRSELLEALIDRFSGWDVSEALKPTDKRLLRVFQDELAAASVQPLHLPLPNDNRLRRVLNALASDLSSGRTIADWARWSGMSKRSLTRSFRKETGMSFAGWRQQARLLAALEKLSEGESVTNVALGVGYNSVSAFIAVFRKAFGTTPGARAASVPRRKISSLLAKPVGRRLYGEATA